MAMWNKLVFLSSILCYSANSAVVDKLPTVSDISRLQNIKISTLQRGAEYEEYTIDEATEDILLSVLPEIKKAVAERISSYTVFLHEDHIFNLLWAVPQLKFTALSYKAEVSIGVGMTYYVKYKVGSQCFQVKVYKSIEGDIRVEDAIGAMQCSFPVIFF